MNPFDDGAAPSFGRGKFLVVEGVDGSGKSSLVQLLAELLRGRLRGKLENVPAGAELEVTAEPTRETWTGRGVRGEISLPSWRQLSPFRKALMFAADRLAHWEDQIRPALERGSWVLSDRYFHTSLAEQGIVDGAGESTVWNLNHAAGTPDWTYILDVLPQTANARISARYISGLEHVARRSYGDPDLSRLARLVQAYRRVPDLFAPGMVLTIQTEGRTLESIARAVLSHLEAMEALP